MGLFTPAWMKTDSKSEKKAIEAVKKITKESDLARIAEQAPKYTVRQAAMNKLTDQNVLARIAVNDAALSQSAVERLTDESAIMYVLNNGKSSLIRILAASKLSDHALGQKIIFETAMNDKEEAVRISAVKLLNDESLLAQVAASKDSTVRMVSTALDKITDTYQFVRIAKEASLDSAREYALNRIDNPEIREEISRRYLTDPNFGAGYSAMKEALLYTNNQDTLIQFVRRKGPNEELKKSAIKKITDIAFLNEIVHSDDEAFRYNHTGVMPNTSQTFDYTLHLKIYAEERLRALGEYKE